MIRIVDVVNESKNPLPQYAHPGDAGMDLRADLSNPNDIKGDKIDYDPERKVFIIWSGGRACIPTGLKVAVPENCELQIRPRSGLALKQGITVLNTPGCVDSGYRQTVGVILINFSDEPFEIANGDRIAQAVLNKFETIKWNPVEALNETDRGDGFGSSGTK